PEGRKGKALEARGVEVWKARATRQGQIALEPLLRKLAAVGLNHVLCEGGGVLAGSLLKARLVDALALFLAPKLLGGDGRPWIGPLGLSRMSQALAVTDVQLEPLGADWLLTGRLASEQASPAPRSARGK